MQNALFDVSAHSFYARFYVFFNTRNHIAALLRHNFPFCIFEKILPNPDFPPCNKIFKRAYIASNQKKIRR